MSISGDPINHGHNSPEIIDPVVLDWGALSLPETWPDKLDLSKLPDLLVFFRKIFGKRQQVDIPDDLLGRELIPKYALQEFHNLPNGNYSKAIACGYITGFDLSMLNKVQSGRDVLAGFLKGQKSVLDVGCAGGKTAAAVKSAGVNDVWGLDISPYLLQYAAKSFPDIKFVQGAAENTGFGDERFDGISASFLFHEIPPKYADQSLEEFNRILEPGGLLAIIEPSPIQLYESNPIKLFKIGGVSAFYFKALARFVYEPFVDSWHRRDLSEWFDSRGFDLIVDNSGIPFRTLLARKRLVKK